MVRKANIVQKQELGGGKGCAEVHEIVPEKDLYGHGKLYAKVVLKPNSSSDSPPSSGASGVTGSFTAFPLRTDFTVLPRPLLLGEVAMRGIDGRV